MPHIKKCLNNITMENKEENTNCSNIIASISKNNAYSSRFNMEINTMGNNLKDLYTKSKISVKNHENSNIMTPIVIIDEKCYNNNNEENLLKKKDETGYSSYICGKCNKSYNRKILLRKHMKIHNRRQYRCSHCIFKCFTLSEMHTHMLEHWQKKSSLINQSISECQFITDVMINDTQMSKCQNNITIDSNNENTNMISMITPSHRNKIKNIRFNRKMNARGSEVNSLLYKNSKIGKVYNENSNMMNPIVIIDEICSNKNQEIYNKDTFSNRYHKTGYSSHICGKCSNRYKTKALLKEHMKIHSRWQYKCSHCIFKCCNLSEMYCHMLEHLQKIHSLSVNWDNENRNIMNPIIVIDEKPSYKKQDDDNNQRSFSNRYDKTCYESYFCGTCRKRCKTKSLLKKHMNIHYRRLFRCSRCIFKCFNLSEMHRHMLTHLLKKSSLSVNSKDKASSKKLKRSLVNICTVNEELSNNGNSENSGIENNSSEDADEMNSQMKNKDNLTTNKNRTIYRCDMCFFELNNKYTLKRHIDNRVCQKSFQCSYCNKSFFKKVNLQMHINCHTLETLFKCNLCDATYTSKDSFRLHVETHNPEKPHKCHLCHYSSHQKSNLRTHFKKHIDEKPFECSKCEYRCKYKQMLVQHNLLHDIKERKFKCNQCSLSFKTKICLKSHERNHGEKLFKCDLCNYSCCRKDSLDSHKRTHTKEKPFKCLHCEYACSTKGALNIHTRRHTGDKPYKCDVCNERFNQHAHLMSHIRIHSNEKLFKCNLCEFSCKQKSGMFVHKQSHNEKILKCNLCDYKCKSNRQLHNHKRVHSDERPYKCTECRNSFRYLQSLKQHMMRHKGETAFSCDICDFSCVRRDTLHSHMLKHTGEKPFECNECYFKCKTKGELTLHMSTHYKNKIEN
ncbi:unnamed protein product, partial [Meganyctiphanes norvegica]